MVLFVGVAGWGKPVRTPLEAIRSNLAKRTKVDHHEVEVSTEETTMPRRLIADIISGRTLITGHKNDTVRDACRVMAQNRIGALLVVEGDRLAGIFTERDALNKVLAAGLDPDETKVAQVMVADLQTIRPSKPLAYALHMMAEGGFRHVPVLDDQGRPVGMVSARDALGADLVELERELKRQEQLESSIGY